MSGASRSRSIAQVLGIALSIGAIFVLVASIDVGRTVNAMLAADGRLLVLAATLVIVQLTVVTTRWGILLAGVAGGRPGLRRLLGPVLLGYLGNFVLPSRLGEVVRSFAVARREGLPMSSVLGTVVIERLVDASVLAVIAMATAVSLSAPDWIANVSAVVAAGGIAVIVVLASPAGPALPRWLRRASLPGAAATGSALHNFAAGADMRRRPMALLAAVGLSGESWLLEGSVYWLVAQSLSLDVSLPVAFLVAAVTVLATAVPSAPAYVGTFELAVTGVATAFGVSPTDALAWALLAHAVTVAPLAVGGIAALILTGQRPADLVEEAEHADLHLDPDRA